MCYKISFAGDNIMAGINLLTLLLFFFHLLLLCISILFVLN